MLDLQQTDLWDDILGSIKTKLKGESFETWFNPIRFEGIDNNRHVIRLRAPNPAVRDWVTVHYASLIDQSFGEVNLPGYSVDWVLPDEGASTLASEVDPASFGTGTAVARAVETWAVLQSVPYSSAQTPQPALDP